MFFLMHLFKYLEMPPRFFGPRLREIIKIRLRQEVTGTCGRQGFIIAVQEIEEIGEGRIRPGTPMVSFPVKYSAIVMRPFKGEVMDAIVSNVHKFGVFCDAGPLKIFVAEKLLPPDFVLDMQANPPHYINREDGSRIEKDSHVRLRILGVRGEQTEIACIGTMKEDYLGLLL